MSTAVRGGTWIPTRDLFLTLIERKLRLLSKRSWLGTAYPAIAPLFLFVLYIFVFHRVLKVHATDYPIYLFSGLLPWTFLAQTLPDTITSVSFEAELIRRSAFRYELLPLASVTAMSLYFLITLTGFVIVLACIGQLNPVVVPVLIVPVACLYLLIATIGMYLALIDIYNRDLRRFLSNLLTIWFFLIPIVYVQSQAKVLVPLRYIDPANILVSEFRNILAYRQLPPWHTMIEGLAICLFIFAVALSTYRRFDDRLPREV
jgi:lipopolysaccharide transport system permease protein